MFHELPDELNRNILCFLTFSDQINISRTCRYFHNLLSLKLILYSNELQSVIHYIDTLRNRNILESCIQHVVFRSGKFKLKFTFEDVYKLKFSYISYGVSFVSESIHSTFYFNDFDSLKAFIKKRVLNCNMYLNTFLFSQKYNFIKVY